MDTDDLRNYTAIGTGRTKEKMMEMAADEIDSLRHKVKKLLRENTDLKDIIERADHGI